MIAAAGKIKISKKFKISSTGPKFSFVHQI